MVHLTYANPLLHPVKLSRTDRMGGMAYHAILWLVRWPVDIRARAHAVGRRNKQLFFSPGFCEARIFRELFLRLWREVNQMVVHPHTERCSEQGC